MSQQQNNPNVPAESAANIVAAMTNEQRMYFTLIQMPADQLQAVGEFVNILSSVSLTTTPAGEGLISYQENAVLGWYRGLPNHLQERTGGFIRQAFPAAMALYDSSPDEPTRVEKLIELAALYDELTPEQQHNFLAEFFGGHPDLLQRYVETAVIPRRKAEAQAKRRATLAAKKAAHQAEAGA